MFSFSPSFCSQHLLQPYKSYFPRHPPLGFPRDMILLSMSSTMGVLPYQVLSVHSAWHTTSLCFQPPLKFTYNIFHPSCFDVHFPRAFECLLCLAWQPYCTSQIGVRWLSTDGCKASPWKDTISLSLGVSDACRHDKPRYPGTTFALHFYPSR